MLLHVPNKSRRAFLNKDVCPLCNSPALYKVMGYGGRVQRYLKPETPVARAGLQKRYRVILRIISQRIILPHSLLPVSPFTAQSIEMVTYN